MSARVTFPLLLLVSCVSLDAARPAPAIAVRRPSIIAFFPPVIPQEADSDTNDALDDFQWYAAEARQPLQDAGIDFHVVYVRSFRVQVRGRRTVTFRPRDAGVGYYFVSPGKTPRIEYGVMTDVDLLEAAKEYFGITVTPLASAATAPSPADRAVPRSRSANSPRR